MNRLIWMGSLCYLLLGLGHVVIGAVLPELLASYGKDYSQGGAILFVQFAGFLVGVLLTPSLSRRWGPRGMVFACLTVLALAQAANMTLPAWPLVYVVAVAAGLGLGSIEAAIGSLVIGTAQERKAVAMSRLEVFFGLGALLMPLIAGLFIHVRQWPLAFAAIAVFGFALAAVWMRMSFGAAIDARLRRNPQRESTESGESVTPLAGSIESGASTAWTEPAEPASFPYSRRGWMMIGLFVVSFFMYVGLEMSLVNFAPSMLVERYGADAGVASIGVTLFWCTMTFGRVFCGILAERIGYLRYLLVSCGVSILGLIGFGAAGGIVSSFLAMALAGLGMAGLFAIALVFANVLLPGTTERTTSMLIASGGIGGAVMPLATGSLMDAGGPVAPVWMLVGVAAVLAALLAATRLMPAEGHRIGSGGRAKPAPKL